MAQAIKNRGWTVTFSGTGINLALGILYTWSIFKGAIKQSIERGGEGAFNWDLASLNDPYAVCCLVFAFAMILSGKCQDRFGPRMTALIGGILVGLGFIWISQTTSYVAWVLGFGLLAGTGIGFGYAAATPPALKWFPPAKTGLIAGLVVSGFGLASVYIAPLAQYLLGIWGLQHAMLFFGIAFLVVVCGLALLLVNPPAGYVPEGSGANTTQMDASGSAKVDAMPSDMMKTRAFYTIWFIYFIGAGAGLMVIGSVAGMAKKSMGELAFLVVAILAVGNAAGRIIAGILSDKIGRNATLMIMLSFQTILMLIAIPVVGAERSSAVLLILLATFIGFNYGTNLSLFPSLTKDKWGLKNFGINYGMVFTAWGVGGFVMGRLSQMLVAHTGTYTSSFLTAAALLIVGAFLTLTLRSGKVRDEVIQKEAALSYGGSD
ncbi:MAG: OFA family MFS transporter [Deltaproteobacteria bacterium]|nr:MAG: OFA family MFS transporter [Deltaproteobacteria bacterium]